MKNILQDIHQYNSTLTISQVVTFLTRRGLVITKSMIQNYVRDGLLRPPVNKRYYTHKHLANLALIDYLKKSYEMSEIRTVLKPFMDDEGISTEMYLAWVNKTEELAAQWRTQVAPLFLHTQEAKLLLMLIVWI